MKEIKMRFTEKSEIEDYYEVTDEEYERIMSGEDFADVVSDDYWAEVVVEDLDKYGYCGVTCEVMG